MDNWKHWIHRLMDIGSGLLIAVLIQVHVFPIYGVFINVWECIEISLIMMCVSIVRSFIWSKYIFKYKL